MRNKCLLLIQVNWESSTVVKRVLPCIMKFDPLILGASRFSKSTNRFHFNFKDKNSIWFNFLSIPFSSEQRFQKWHECFLTNQPETNWKHWEVRKGHGHLFMQLTICRSVDVFLQWRTLLSACCTDVFTFNIKSMTYCCMQSLNFLKMHMIHAHSLSYK